MEVRVFIFKIKGISRTAAGSPGMNQAFVLRVQTHLFSHVDKVSCGGCESRLHE